MAEAWILTESSGGVMQESYDSGGITQIHIDWDEITIPDNPEYVHSVLNRISVLPTRHRDRILDEIEEHWQIEDDGSLTWRNWIHT